MFSPILALRILIVGVLLLRRTVRIRCCVKRFGALLASFGRINPNSSGAFYASLSKPYVFLKSYKNVMENY